MSDSELAELLKAAAEKLAAEQKLLIREGLSKSFDKDELDHLAASIRPRST